MPLANCSICGRVYNKTHRDVCPVCWEAEHTWSDTIAEYLQRNANASAADVIAHTGIPQTDLIRMLRRGHLRGYDQLAELLTCERCGAVVDRGTMCAACRSVVLQLTGGDPADPDPSPGDALIDGDPSRPVYRPTPKPETRPLPPEGPDRGRDTNQSRHDFWRNRAR
jgi:RNA polymerase subunit RPABC4/transcription elongation factor Spt4